MIALVVAVFARDIAGCGCVFRKFLKRIAAAFIFPSIPRQFKHYLTVYSLLINVLQNIKKNYKIMAKYKYSIVAGPFHDFSAS